MTSDRPGIYVSKHVVQRISERAGVEMTWQDVLGLIPAHKRDRIGRGEHFKICVEELGLDLICMNRAILTALPTVAHKPFWRRTKAVKRRAMLDDVEEIVVGGRVRRIEA